MKTILIVLLGAVLAIAGLPADSDTTKVIPGEGAAGEWLGALDLGAVKLRLALHIESLDDDEFKATLDSIDQGAMGLAVDQAEFQERKLKLVIKRIGGYYQGTMNEDGSSIEGTWSQGGVERPLTFHRVETPFTLKRPQNPKPPFPYQSRDVTFQSGEIKLAGTYIHPRGAGPFPAVLFITGSGAQDRDESLMGHKPFWVIADDLARRGIASLRYDDRGFGESEGKHIESTIADFAADAEAGLAFLAVQAEVDRNALGIIGHSEGGLTGPKMAASNPDVNFLVLLAAPGERLDLLVRRQGRDILEKMGLEASLIERATRDQDEFYELLKGQEESGQELMDKLEAITLARRNEFTPEERALLRIDEAVIKQQLATIITPWFRSLMREDPSAYLKSIRVPVLALFGELDVQVAPQVNAPLVEKALRAAGNGDFQVTILPGLNHLFQHAETGLMDEYGNIEETFAPEALAMIGDWIRERFVKE